MGYVNKIQIGNSAHLIEPTLYAETGGTAAAITATITGFEAIEGVVISLKITTSNSASATLNVNSGGEKAIYYNAAAIAAGTLQEGHIYNFIYLNNSWYLLGDLTKIEVVEALNNVTLPHKLTFGAGGVYQFDGSADVTVPVYTGGII